MTTLLAPTRPETGVSTAELGLFLGSVVEYSATGKPLMETFYYHKNGMATGYTFGGTAEHKTCGSSIQWAAASVEQLREWLSFEQVAAGFRRAVAVQQKPVGMATPAPLLRLRAAARAAITKANEAAAAPLRGWGHVVLDLDSEDVQAA